MANLIQDLCYAFRQLRRAPGSAVVAILTLALGVGLNSAMFRVVDAVILRELPVKNPKQLVFPIATGPHGTDDGFAYSEFEQIRDDSKSLAGSFAFDTTRFLASVDDQQDYLFGQCVSPNFYSVLGVVPVLGRAFVPQDNQAGQAAVAVISYDYWQRRFAGNPAVLNDSILIKNIPFRVVGVTPPSFHGIELGDSVDIWIPMLHWPRVRLADHLTVGIMGRLKASASLSQAAAELSVIDQQYAERMLGQNTVNGHQNASLERKIELRSGARGLFDLPDELPNELHILMAVAGFVLLIACANVANLQLARSISRVREIATRLALGASRPRLMRHLLIESLVLAIAGGGLGFLVANYATSVLLRFVIPGFDSVGLDSVVDARAVWFSASIAVLSGFLLGLVPAFRIMRLDAAPTLQGAGRVETTDKSKSGLSRALLVMQTAICVALLVGTGLMVRSLKKLSQVDAGFRRDHVLLAFIYPTLGGYEGPKEQNLYATLQDQMEAAPGVLSASLSRFPLLSGGGGWQRRVSLPSGAQGESSTPVHCNPISPQFFATMGIPLILGRDFSASDSSNSLRVAIISETLARKAFPNESAIGKRIQFVEGKGDFAEVVGIARDVHSFELRAPDSAASLYVPQTQAPADKLGQAVLEIRTTEQTSVAVSSLRRVMGSIDAHFPLARISTQAEQTSESLTNEHSLATLLSLFSALAVALASIGLYGVIAYSTARRTREIGIRVALGARRRRILRMILGDGLRVTLLGMGIGFAGAVAGSRVLASHLFGVTATDPFTLLGVAVVVLSVTFAACYIPARRAARVDPMVALRYE